MSAARTPTEAVPLQERRRPPSRRKQGKISAALIAVGASVLALAPLVTFAPQAGLHPPVLIVLILLTGAAALYRPVGGANLGLGSLALPPAAWVFGPAVAAWVAALASVTGELLRRAFEAGRSDPLPERRRSIRLGVDAARIGIATLVAGLVLHRAPAQEHTFDGRIVLDATPTALLAGGVAFVLCLFALELGERLLRGVHPGRDLGGFLPSLLVDGLGWLVGGFLIPLVALRGWSTLLPVLAAIGILVVEITLSAYRRADLERRARDLQTLGAAGERMAPIARRRADLAETILGEVRNAIDFSWFHLELPAENRTVRSWRAGPTGSIEEGAPQPSPSPPPLPGIHRRRRWTLIDRELERDGRTVGRLRLWCDPRRLESQQLELLEVLIPQLAATAELNLLDREARLDGLTGIPVRKVLIDGLEHELSHVREHGGSVAVVLCDIDFFKKINDTWGHGVGDRVLVLVAGLIESGLRDDDQCCRYGGEEFALLLPATDGRDALRLAERLRQTVAQTPLVVDGGTIELTLSAGVAAFPELVAGDSDELLAIADDALYAAKERGRNRVLQSLGNGRYRNHRGRTLGAKKKAVVAPQL